MTEAIAARSRWQVYPRRHDQLLNHICQIRGFASDDLRPDYNLHLHDPNLLPDMKIARELIRRAVSNQWSVTIFGDYDADGTPAAALLSQTFARLGLTQTVVLPTRQTGYGLRLEQIDAIAQTAQLLITVDTGISSVAEIKRAKKLGLKVIVLDHHVPPNILPPADALVDPHRLDSRYPFKHLCGCALAFKLVCSLRDDFPEINDTFCKWLLDLVAISTVADMMPLIGENRALVHYGLVVIRQNRRLGLRTLLKVAGVEIDGLSSSTLGYIIGPRLNASGRLGDNRPAYQLLITDDEREAEQLAEQLETANQKRQSLVDNVLLEARALLAEQNSLNDRVLLIYKDGWPAGVVGLVAGRLASEHNRPVVIGSLENGQIKASARSIEKYSIIDGLTRQASLLQSFGGHSQAAGLSVAHEQWPNFTEALKRDAEPFLTAADFYRTYRADAVLTKADLTLDVAQSLEALEPFGLGNTKPLLILENAIVNNARFIGSKTTHLKLDLESACGRVEAIGFNLAERYQQRSLNAGHFLGNLEVNHWRGTHRLQMRIIDFQPKEGLIETIDG